MIDAEENAYIQGRRAAMAGLLRTCLSELGYDEMSETAHLQRVIEREETWQALAGLSAQLGVEQFDTSIHLADWVRKIEDAVVRLLETGCALP